MSGRLVEDHRTIAYPEVVEDDGAVVSGGVVVVITIVVGGPTGAVGSLVVVVRRVVVVEDFRRVVDVVGSGSVDGGARNSVDVVEMTVVAVEVDGSWSRLVSGLGGAPPLVKIHSRAARVATPPPMVSQSRWSDLRTTGATLQEPEAGTR